MPQTERERETNMDEFKTYLAETYGVPVMGFRKLPTQEESVALRELQMFVNALVTEHDKLADDVAPKRRLVGKRGRKAGSGESVDYTDPANIIGKLS